MSWPSCVVWLAGVASASAQVSERLEIGAIVRTDRVSFEGGQNARLPVTGVGRRVSRVAGRADRRRSHDGVGRIEAQLRRRFHFVRGTWATREEFQRMAVIARRTTINKAGLGFATAVAVETRQPGRVNLALRAGVSVRQYDYIEDTTVLRVPEGVTFEQAESRHAGWSRTAGAQRAAVWRQRAGSHRRPPSRRAGGAMGVGRSGTDRQQLRRRHRRRAGCLEVLTPKSAMLILEET